MLKITLDTNCIIDLEHKTECFEDLESLVKWHKQGKLLITFSSLMPSENTKSGVPINSFCDFRQRLSKINLDDAVSLKSITYWGLGYWDEVIYGTDDMFLSADNIRGILFPNPQQHFRKQKNEMIDSLAMWAHIWYKNDIFITNDDNFHKSSKKPKLIALGAGKILYPSEAVKYIKQLDLV